MGTTVILLLVFAYFLIAIASLADKFLLTKAVPEPVVYTILISTFGLVAIILAPFGFTVPSYQELLIVALAGSTFTFALFFLYTSLRDGEASRVLTFIGALTAFLTYVFSFLFLGERLSANQIFAFALLLVGGAIIILDKSRKKRIGRWIIFGISSAFLFAVSYTAARYAYSSQGFITGFVWLRIFAFLTAVLFLLNPGNRRQLVRSLHVKSGIQKKSNQVILVGAQLLNGIGFLILNYLISLISAAIVLASQGLQYVFVLVFTVILSRKLPHVLNEKYSPAILLQKLFAIILIAGGLALLTYTKS